MRVVQFLRRPGILPPEVRRTSELYDRLGRVPCRPDRLASTCVVYHQLVDVAVLVRGRAAVDEDADLEIGGNRAERGRGQSQPLRKHAARKFRGRKLQTGCI